MTVTEAWADWHATGPIETPDAINPLFAIGYRLSLDPDIDMRHGWHYYAQKNGLGSIAPPRPFLVGWGYGRATLPSSLNS